jgi:hypothetical protein
MLLVTASVEPDDFAVVPAAAIVSVTVRLAPDAVPTTPAAVTAAVTSRAPSPETEPPADDDAGETTNECRPDGPLRP